MVKKNSLPLISYSFSPRKRKREEKKANIFPRETFLRATSSSSPFFLPLRLRHPRAQQVEIARRERRGETDLMEVVAGEGRVTIRR